MYIKNEAEREEAHDKLIDLLQRSIRHYTASTSYVKRVSEEDRVLEWSNYMDCYRKALDLVHDLEHYDNRTDTGELWEAINTYAFSWGNDVSVFCLKVQFHENAETMESIIQVEKARRSLRKVVRKYVKEDSLNNDK